MSKRPSFQFYPADWQANANLKRCTFEEKGVWLEVMFLLHDSEEYGILRWSLEEISLAVRCNISILFSLVKKSVLKGSDNPKEKVSFSTSISQKNRPPAQIALIDAQPGPFWYSSRMVRDEYIRKRRADAGCKSLLHPNVPKKKQEKDGEKDLEKDTFSPSPSSSSSSSSTNIKIKSQACRFAQFWDVYPRKENKKRAQEIWKRKNLNENADFIISDVCNRKDKHDQWKEIKFIPHATTYLNGERWKDAITEHSNGKCESDIQSNGRNAQRTKSNSEKTWDFLSKAAGLTSGENFIESESNLPAKIPKLVSD